MPAPRNHREELTSTAVALGGIWSAVLAISLFSPDMVSGSEQQHLPIAAMTSWLWGSVATGAVMTFWARTRPLSHGAQVHRPVAVTVVAIWVAAAVVAVFSPEMVTGSDPTRIPLAAVLAPIAATVLTVLARAAAELVGHVLQEDTDTQLAAAPQA